VLPPTPCVLYTVGKIAEDAARGWFDHGQERLPSHRSARGRGADAVSAPAVALPVLPAEAVDPGFRRFYDYWASRAPAGQLPGRQHIDPLDIPHLLAGVMLYDVVPGQADAAGNTARFRVRIAGEMLVGILGYNPAGRFLDEFVLADRRGVVNAAFARVARERIAHYWENQLWTAGREYIRMRRLALPLARDGANPDMVIAYHVRSELPPPE